MRKISKVMLTLALAGAMTAFAAAPAYADDILAADTGSVVSEVETDTETDTETVKDTKDEPTSSTESKTSSAASAASSKAASSKAASSKAASSKSDKSPKTGDTSALAIAFASTALVMFAAFAEHSSKKKNEE